MHANGSVEQHVDAGVDGHRLTHGLRGTKLDHATVVVEDGEATVVAGQHVREPLTEQADFVTVQQADCSGAGAVQFEIDNPAALAHCMQGHESGRGQHLCRLPAFVQSSHIDRWRRGAWPAATEALQCTDDQRALHDRENTAACNNDRCCGAACPFASAQTDFRITCTVAR
jgi:hypothetical protein